MTNPTSDAREILNNIKFITIATVTEGGEPWNTPVAGFHFDDNYVLYWASWTNNQHSKNIRHNGKAFIVVYDSTPSDGNPSSGVYIQAKVTELNDKQEVIKAALVFKGDLYNPSDGNQYLGDHPRRIYKAKPIKVWMNGDGKVNGEFIDRRIEAEE
jgi:uncharacterized pyridoxamine 5'-phosphate oxidase family protein